MSVLLLRLAGPMQAWGVKSRFEIRSTESVPSKSGVVGLLAGALGRRRTDSVDDIARLAFAVRQDQPGFEMDDFHTVSPFGEKSKVISISHRWYIADGAFLVGLEGEEEKLQGLAKALDEPKIPLYLGRRSCPPVGQLNLGIHEGNLWDVMRAHEWIASPWYRKKCRGKAQVKLLIDVEAVPEQSSSDYVVESNDIPVSFDQRQRVYASRRYEVHRIVVEDSAFSRGVDTDDSLDPMRELME